jgi:hypothetical protein
MNIVIDCTLHNLLWILIVLIKYLQLYLRFNCTTFIIGRIWTAFIIILVALSVLSVSQYIQILRAVIYLWYSQNIQMAITFFKVFRMLVKS